MHLFIRLVLFIVLIFAVTSDLKATHNRAGEITVTQLAPCEDYMIEATVITYTKASSQAADRDSLTICWGDGLQFCETVYRSNGPNNNGEILENDIKLNRYVAIHQYPSSGTYSISMTDPNRNGGILNVNAPASDQVQFHIQTTHTLLNCQFNGLNSSPILDYEPVDVGCVGQPFFHNPGAYDPDGDSLSYELIVPFGDLDTEVPNYQFPNQIPGGGGNIVDFFISPTSGLLTWNTPLVAGEYNIAFHIISWRNGIPIDIMVRDMQVTIEDCEDNKPPTIEVIDEICVVAGDLIEIDVVASDPDEGQKVKLIARGGPFNVSVSPAQFPDGTFFETPPVGKLFTWQTSCEHIASQSYEVIFRATDNFLDTTGLSTIKMLRIKVVGPAPDEVEAQAIPGEIELFWENPYACEFAEEDYFYGFSVWRRENSTDFDVDCEPGLEGRGYTQITNFTREIVDNKYYYKDENVERGKTYCYRILAKFAKYTSAGNPPNVFNVVESLPSLEVCVQLKQDVPLLTNVDVLTTDPQNGEIEIKWIAPKAEDLDTLLNPGPYKYELMRSIGIGTDSYSLVPGGEFTADNFYELTATEFLDNIGLNTLEEAYSYRLDFYINGENEPIKSANFASSVFLSAVGADERNDISWNYSTPWENYDFVIFKKNVAGLFEMVDTVQTNTYSDVGLVNGREYCYYVETIGAYSVDGIPAPLFNKSQQVCATPIDTIPPCPPDLVVQNICDLNINCIESELDNTLTWTNPMNFCTDTDDVVSYNIYYAETDGADFSLIGSTEDSNDTTFLHQPIRGIAGCYKVTAIDSFFNESLYSNTVCVDNCPQYNLPNTFTPNNDGQNDVFIPYPYCFIERIEMSVFNRWGQLVFSTNNPDILWDGRNQNGDLLAAGTYYYTCQVFEQRVNSDGNNEVSLSGFIELIRDDN